MTHKIYVVKVEFTLEADSPKEAVREIKNLLFLSAMPGGPKIDYKIKSMVEEKVMLE